jgi:RHS repeat-associated protein
MFFNNLINLFFNRKLTLVLFLLIILFFGAVNFAEETEAPIPATFLATNIELSNLAPELSGDISLKHNAFHYGDINLSQGIVQFTETDLSLPGKNGLNLTISRTYNSRNYRNNPDLDLPSNSAWGAYAGHGWAFNVGMRAFLLHTPNDEHRKIVLQDTSGSTIFQYNPNNRKYESTRPGDFRIFKLDNNITASDQPFPSNISLNLILDSGHTLAFQTPFYYEDFSGTHNFPFHITGFSLNSISDIYGNSIQYHYYTVNDWHNLPSKSLNKTIGNDFYDYLASLSKTSSHADFKLVRISKITDSFEREININYKDSWNRAQDFSDYMISAISYKNTNGDTNTIKYSYDTAGNLSNAQVGDLPAKQYSYLDFRSSIYCFSYHWQYETSFGIHSSTTQELYTHVDFRNYKRGDPIWEETRASALDGFLLNRIHSPLGSSTEYEYRDSLKTKGPEMGRARIPVENIIGKRGPRVADHYYYSLIAQASYPVVISKRILNNTETNVFRINYQKDRYGNIRNSKTGYIPPGSSDPTAKAYFFPSVTIDAPSEILDEHFVFDKGLATRHTKGIFETITEWDFSFNRQNKVTTKKNNKIISETRYEYTSYNNPSRVITRIGNPDGNTTTEYLQQDISYYTDTKFLDNNLLHLVKSSKTTDKQTLVFRASFVTYTDQGKVFEQYKGENTAGTKLKENVYDSVGRISREKILTSDGSELEIGYTYLLGATYDVIKQINGETMKTLTKKFDINTGKLVSSIDFNDNQTDYNYDSYGRIISTSFPDNTQKTFTYNNATLKELSETYCGRTVTKYLDNLGRLEYIDNPDTQEDIKYTYHFAQAQHEVFKGTYPSSWTKVKSYNYDQNLRKTSVTHTDWGTTSYDYEDFADRIIITDPRGRIAQKNFNIIGKLESETFAGKTTAYTYNAFGELLYVTDPRGLIHKSDFDSEGKLTNTYNTGKELAGLNKRSLTSYLPNNLPSSLKIYNPDSTIAQTYSYEYDKEGRITDLLLDNQIKEQCIYDQNNNGKGKLSSTENDICKLDYEYDNMGRLIKEHRTLKTHDNKEFTLEHIYNSKGLLESEIYSQKNSTELYQLNYEYYDETFNLKTIDYKGKRFSYTYNNNGTIRTITYPTGLVVDFSSYDKEVLLTDMDIKNPDGTTKFHQTYNYDILGNMTHALYDEKIGGAFNVTYEFDYNTHDELTSVKRDNQENYYKYEYDQNGNRTKFESMYEKDLANDNFIIDPNSDRLIERKYEVGTIRFEYDANGNLSRKKIFNDHNTANPIITYDFTFNYQGQLTQVQKDNTTIATYEFDPLRQRISKTVDFLDIQETNFYHWNAGGQIIIESTKKQTETDLSDPAPTITTKYIYNGNEKIAMIKTQPDGTEQMYYFINNLQGTPIYIIDEGNRTVERIQVDPFGNMEQMQGIFNEELNFTGKKLDPVTGLFYFNQRYYDPDLGRFITEDPAGQGLNPYAYCANNPLMYVDPDGEFWWFVGAIVDCAIKGAISGAFIGGSMGAISAVVNNEDFFSSIWDGAMGGAITGAISGGITGGIKHLAGGAINGISGFAGNSLGMGNGAMSSLVSDGMRAGMYAMGESMAMGNNMSLANAWGSFSGGFGSGVLQSAADMVYKNQTGLNDYPGPGEGYAGDGTVRDRLPGEPFVGAETNSIGVPANQKVTNPLDFILAEVFPGREGKSIASKFLNQIYGQNAHSKIHDTWSKNGILAFAATPASLYITYSGLRNKLRR